MQQLHHPLTVSTLGPEERCAAAALLLSDRQLSMGAECAAFEAEFAAYMGGGGGVAGSALFVNSGSSANMLAVMAALTGPRALRRGIDKVAVPALCWSTTVSPFLLVGIEPVFIDVDPATLQIDLRDLDSKLAADPSIRCLMLVHVLGGCADMHAILRTVAVHGLVLIEDACEAMGNSFDGRRLGTFGDFGTFSTFFSHHMTSIEGGFLLCKSAADAETACAMRAHGWTRHLSAAAADAAAAAHPDIDRRFLFIEAGLNFRPTEVNAVIGRIQLRKLDAMNAVRRQNLAALRTALSARGFAGYIPAWDPAIALLAIPIMFRSVTAARASAALEQRGVQTRPVISGNFTRQPVLRKWLPCSAAAIEPAAFPGAEAVHTQGLYIGLHSELIADVAALADAICAAAQ